MNKTMDIAMTLSSGENNSNVWLHQPYDQSHAVNKKYLRNALNTNLVQISRKP
jgi:hypothetical protein